MRGEGQRSSSTWAACAQGRSEAVREQVGVERQTSRIQLDNLQSRIASIPRPNRGRIETAIER